MFPSGHLFRLVFISGDFCPSWGVIDPLLQNNAAESVFGDFFKIVQSADVAITNLECPLTLSNDSIKKIGPNLNGFVRGFEGTNLARKDTIINGLLQSDYSFEKKQMDTLFIVHGRLIIQDSNVWFFNYMSKIPVTNNSLESKDRFFKSIQIK